MSENALRVLGFSMRIIPAIPDDDDTDLEDSMTVSYTHLETRAVCP